MANDNFIGPVKPDNSKNWVFESLDQLVSTAKGLGEAYGSFKDSEITRKKAEEEETAPAMQSTFGDMLGDGAANESVKKVLIYGAIGLLLTGAMIFAFKRL